MKNTTLYVLGVAAVAVLAFIMVYKPGGTLAASLALADGSVEIDFGDGKWMAAREGDGVKAGTNLRTAQGKAVVSFDDGSVMRLDAFTEVHVETITRNAITVENLSGRVYSRVDKTGDLVWTVKSLGTETTALGTAFSVQGNNNNKQVNVDVFESKVKVKVKKDDGLFEKEVAAGKGLIVDQSQPLSKATAEKTVTVETAKKDAFVKWNIQEDAKTDEPLGDFASVATEEELAEEALAVEEALKTEPAPAPVVKTVAVETEPAPKPAPAPTPYIKLAAIAGDAGVKLTWSIGGGLTAPYGFKVVKSKELKPVYPGNDYNYLSNPDARSFVWKVADGETYHFRVCTYNGDGACKTYSNDVSIKTALAVKEPAKSSGSGFEYIGTELQLSAMPIDGAVKLSWSPCTSSTFQGYKVVRSETDSNPYYPNNGYLQYITSRDSTYYKDTNVTAGKSYYYRICSLQSDGPVTCGNVVQVTY